MNLLLIVFLTLASSSLAAIDTTCKNPGEYCLNHWDCCTNTCLSYLYKCSSIPAQMNSFSQSSAPAFQSPAYYAPASPTVETLSYEGLLDFIFTPLRVMVNAIGSEDNSIKSRLGDEADEEEQETKTENQVITTTDGPSTQPQCMEIGSKCYFNEDCCTKRCHGFLHQCVT
ncbi:uncharacterized protein LOC129915323 [Episyrphus balteatus]|uniref:uncharacterized protein LOC129915323 n=1 Tax=Episyrphus balteatus TaxID=286459 RepID=UPI002486A612|nr:uncharacterized protein LOC129915323 [Episyrphus balteatus]